MTLHAPFPFKYGQFLLPLILFCFIVAGVGGLESESSGVCPDACICTEEEDYPSPGPPQTSCTLKNLTVIPPNLPRTTEILSLTFNRISRLNNHIFNNYSKLRTLNLGHNWIEHIDPDAFVGLPNLNSLELNNNRLREVPIALAKLPNLQELNLANNRIVQIETPFRDYLGNLVMLEIKANPITWYHPEAFSHLRQLKTLIFSDVKNLTEFPHLNGTSSLEILRIDRCSLHYIPQQLCALVPRLKNLDLKSNKIENLPLFQGCQELMILDVSMNHLQELEEGGLEELRKIHHLHLSHNNIQTIPAQAFQGLSQLQELDLSYNAIIDIHPDAFIPTVRLEDLNLGNNYFPKFPAWGLNSIVHLKVPNNPNLREFPGRESFPQARKLVLSYAYHCCQFTAYGMGRSSAVEPPIKETVIYPTDNVDYGNFSQNGISSHHDFWDNIGAAFPSDPSSMEDYHNIVPSRDPELDIKCIPHPGPFLPCNDLFDWWTLRCGVWVVFLLALMGNGTVVFVLIFARTKMDVPRFLVCNLAIADFFMGVYLGFLAVVDAATLGEFRKFAIPWQLSRGCQTAGFLGVLSSELSVYTLAVITMERHYAITHAMHLNKRLSVRHASYIMVVGWIFALIMAVLPLFGISDYRKFAVCLPFETGDGVSMSYVVFLMFANGVAFTILMGCYLKMYCSIRGSQAWNSNDTRIAKRMALLVFTDLLCWFPIAFFSLTAVFGLQLISLEQAKVFTVFVLPLNSCCNPFLYAILTKQFKKDCVLICKAIEESRVTRGIGRCRHSSNFSNRQTAANTGSLVEKSSKDGQPCICHSGLHIVGGDENGNSKYRAIPPSEWWNNLGPLGRFFSRYILCQTNKDSRKSRDDYRMRNVRRFLYTSTPGNHPPDVQKHHRHASVSSDNFSSSRSDSWRIQARCGIPLRLLEPRRRNSWAVTRKPSQDSNLSSSRNDSSATSNSTATWRLSRSSVSSDAASHSGGGKSSLRRTLAAAAATTHNYANTTRPLVTSANPIILPGSVLKPQKMLSFQEAPINSPSVQPPAPPAEDLTEKVTPLIKPSQSMKPSVRINPNPVVVASTKKSGIVEDDDGVIDDDELSAKIATNRPRLVRQSAFFSDEVVIEPEICPVHGPLIPGTYDNEDEDPVSDLDEEDEGDDENGDPSSPILRKQANPYSIALVIVPRRLSTISSRESGIVDETNSSASKWSELGPAGAAMIASTSSPARVNSSNLMSAAVPVELSRRKLSEQPVKYYVLPPATSGALTRPKWYSMSSVEMIQGETQPQVHAQSMSVSSPIEETPQSGQEAEGKSKEDNFERRVSFQLPSTSKTSPNPEKS
ncbi:unnamed protein product [Allacma fusca]|uniref:G-protein coupled receptors family 1 profile domain-containing protein n=1 Tax=Allacma fusca TaxID=39272 RepID=A0A8J2KE74_9HEXA|nr:unnamed protein product [Allacma fusca]